MSSPQEEHRDPNEQQSSQGTASAPLTSEGELIPGGNLDKVRNILFGAQARDYERRFARLEERFSKETGDLRDDMRRRFDALEATLKREIEELGDRIRSERNEREISVRDVSGQLKETTRQLQDRIKAEQNDRSDALGELAGELRNTANGIERRISHLDEQSSKANRELRDMANEQARKLAEQLHQKTEELWAALSKASGELRSEKTDRASLAALFTEVAMRLNDDFKLPSDE
jgi:hypothetical protein